MDFSPRELYGAPSPELELAWHAQQDLLRRVDALTRQAGGRLLVVNVASVEAMRPEAFARDVGEGSDFDWDRPARRLAAICQHLGIEFLDLNPVFRREADPDSNFFPSDIHWSPRGHEVAARAVAERIRTLAARRE
jgi:lysophospholipase L1-like esterase